MVSVTSRRGCGAFFLAFQALVLAQPAAAGDLVTFRTPGATPRIEALLRGASRLLAAEADKTTEAQDLFADAQAEYGALLGALYGAGYYSGVIHVYLDGREAAAIPPLDAPDRIGAVEVVVDPGPAFVFGAVSVHPLPRRAPLPEGFAPGKPAESGVVAAAVGAGIDAWRARGHAKAAVEAQDVVADHGARRLSADVTLDPGPRLRFGPLAISGQARMRPERIRAIAGIPEGEVFDPEELDRARSRLRKAGVFRSVTLEEGETILAPDLLPLSLGVVEEKLRRYSFGAELASLDGASVSAQWTHRNLFGGAERLVISGEVTNIGAQSSGVDYVLGASLSRPATLTVDTTATLSTELGHYDEADYDADTLALTFGLTRDYSDQLSGSLGLSYAVSRVEDEVGETYYRHLALPVSLTWDRRNAKLDATRGFYLTAEARPFLGFGTTDSGARFSFDARGYKGFGAQKGVVLAARLQGGAVLGADLVATPRDYLFYSGGGGTVRGQPYQSLGVSVLRGTTSVDYGGTWFLGGSLEGRVRVTPKIGLVGFVDLGQIGFEGESDWHAGAGLGLRYATPVGPIRLDLAMPAGGDTGDGLQVYVGIGQAF